jgi:hypothetical protein
MSTGDGLLQPTRSLLFGVLLVATAMLSLETLLPRVFAVYVGPNFVYFSISIALVGLSSGGIVASVWEDRFRRRPRHHLVTAALWFAMTTLLATLLIWAGGESLNARLDAIYDRVLAQTDVGAPAAVLSRAIVVPSMLFVLGAGVVLTIPFSFAGLALSLAFRFCPQAIGRVYAFDLVGAGLGCMLTVVALTWLSAANAFVLLSVLAAAGALLFAWPERVAEWKASTLAVAAILGFAALFLFGVMVRAPFEFHIHRYAHLRSFLDGPAEETQYKWTPLGRIAILHRMWSPPLNEQPNRRMKHMVAMDLGGHSVLEKFTPENLAVIKHTSIFTDDIMESIVVPGFYRPELREYLVLMAGNGQDMMRAWAWYGDRINLQGVELNPVVFEFGFDFPEANLREFFSKPNVKMNIDEGRSFVERSRKKFDLILLSYSGATFATGTGSLASTPQFLFTQQAYEAYLRKLNPGGVLVIAGGTSPDELPDSTRTFVAALRKMQPGADPRKHVLCYQRKGAPRSEQYTIYHRDPLSDADVQRIAQSLAEHNLVVTWSAYTPSLHPPVAAFFAQPDPGAPDAPLTFRNMAFDRIHTDNQPFYYFSLVWGTIGGYLVIGYITTLASALLVALVFLLAPLALARRRQQSGARISKFYLLAFGLLGAGFILIEVGSIQKFELFLGNPTLALVVILATLLIWTGLGSYYSSRLFDSGLLSVRRVAFGVVLYGIFVLWFLNSLIYSVMGLPLGAKIALIALVLLPMGFLLGNLFPQLIRQLGPEQQQFIPLAWALNGVFSVAGSNLGAIIYLFWGATAVVVFGLLCYAVLGVAATAIAPGRS